MICRSRRRRSRPIGVVARRGSAVARLPAGRRHTGDCFRPADPRPRIFLGVPESRSARGTVSTHEAGTGHRTCARRIATERSSGSSGGRRLADAGPAQIPVFRRDRSGPSLVQIRWHRAASRRPWCPAATAGSSSIDSQPDQSEMMEAGRYPGETSEEHRQGFDVTVRVNRRQHQPVEAAETA